MSDDRASDGSTTDATSPDAPAADAPTGQARTAAGSTADQATTATGSAGTRHRRFAVYYLVMGALTAAGLIAAFTLGSSRHPEPTVAGVWAFPASAPNPCFGPAIVLQQSGSFASIQPSAGGPLSNVRVSGGVVSGNANCLDGSHPPLRAVVTGSPGTLHLLLADRPPSTATNTGQPLPPAGTKPIHPSGLAGSYANVPPSACLGAGVTVAAAGHDRYALESLTRTLGSFSFDPASGAIKGTVTCPAIGRAALGGIAVGRTITLLVTGPSGLVDHVQLQRTRESENLFGAFFLTVAIVMLAAQLGGLLMTKLGQPRVMGEVLAGILLGPTLLGTLAPQLEITLFPSDVVPYLSVAANLGLIFYMFLIGLEVDLGALQGRVLQALAISNTGVAVPMALGTLVAVPLYALLGTQASFTAFALFMGVSMSITAFPVLARILVERRMLHRPLGVLAIASAAIDDVTAWTLIAVASAAAGSAGGFGVGGTIALTGVFAAAMVVLVRPLLGRVAVAFSETGRLPVGWIVAIFAGVLLSAYVTEVIGVAIIFGAFVMGTIMPRHAGLTEDVTRRLDSFVATVLLPLFFASTGLNTNMLLLGRPELLLITLLLCVVAIGGKFGGTVLAARVGGVSWRDSSVLGTLLNTRGLTELIVLNLALERGVISQALFAALVVMALVTTFMTGPVLRLLDRDGTLGADTGDALDEALPVSAEAAPPPSQKILIAPETSAGLEPLLSIAVPLARSEPPRELVIVRLLKPTAAAEVRGALQTEQRALARATDELRTLRSALAADGVAARGAALTSTDPGTDIAKLAEREGVDLVLLDGRRPLVGSAIPGGASRGVLAHAAPDVVVVVSSERHQLPPAAGAAVVVPFGGAPHDWAAVELGAWLSTAFAAPLKLVGAARGRPTDPPDHTRRRPTDGPGGDPPAPDPDASRLLANTSLMLQRFYGVESEPIIAEAGAAGILSVARDAGLIVVGLSDRWHEEGLGHTRAELARRAPAPILFVRRGGRRGVLAGREDVTRFTWSAAGKARLDGPAAPG
jgi:K+:H+ antiporter